MSFLMDTNTCSVFMRRPSNLFHRFIQHSGRLYVSSVGLSELYSWAYKQNDPSPILARIHDLLKDVQVLSFDEPCALELGRVRGALLKRGISIGAMDLMIATVALVHDLTLVTHNVADFRDIPNLRIEDWLAP
jgi:tRNA(fMet)-specific endonuclease VapC